MITAKESPKILLKKIISMINEINFVTKLT